MTSVSREKKKHEDQPQTKDCEMSRVVESGAIYFTSVDEIDIRLESALVKAADIAAAAGYDPNSVVLIQMFKDGTEKKLKCDDTISLCQYGVEKFRTEKLLVTICINRKDYEVRPGTITVKDLKILAGIPLAHEVAEVTCDGLKTLPADGVVCISGGEKFVSFPRDGQAS